MSQVGNVQMRIVSVGIISVGNVRMGYVKYPSVAINCAIELRWISNWTEVEIRFNHAITLD